MVRCYRALVVRVLLTLALLSILMLSTLISVLVARVLCSRLHTLAAGSEAHLRQWHLRGALVVDAGRNDRAPA